MSGFPAVLQGTLRKSETVAALSADASPILSTTPYVLTCTRTSTDGSVWYRLDSPSVADGSYFSSDDLNRRLEVVAKATAPFKGQYPVRNTTLSVVLPLPASEKVDSGDNRQIRFSFAAKVPVTDSTLDQSSGADGPSRVHLAFELLRSILTDTDFIEKLITRGAVNSTIDGEYVTQT